MPAAAALTWDIFIAHAGADGAAAEELYDRLQGRARVFLDTRCLEVGDNWDEELARAQRASLMSVVLVSSRTEHAYYQREEIAAAIDLARRGDGGHRVVPVYLDPGARAGDSVPYGLRLKHGLEVHEGAGMSAVADALIEALARLREKARRAANGASLPDAVSPAPRAPSGERDHSGAGELPPSRGLAASWARSLVTLSVGVGVGLAPYLGTMEVPFFKPLLDMIPESLRDTTIPLSAALMGLVAVAVEWYGRERLSPSLMRWGFGAALGGTLVALLAFMWIHASTVVTVHAAGGSTKSFVVGTARPSTCGCPPTVSDEQCINGLSWNESAIAECWGDRQIRRAGLVLRLNYLLTTGLFGALVGFLALRRR